ncbi:MAG: hypothetical protein WC956_01840 [bacterium]
MKKVLAVVVALGLCGLYWLGCQKKQGAPEGAMPAAPAVTKPAPAMTPPPPPPPPPAGEEKKAE